MDITWACEMAVLWGYDYWDMHTLYITAPDDIPYWKLDQMARDKLWEDDAFDDASGAYLFSDNRLEE